MSFEDKSIKCVDCDASFVWTMKEQEFYVQKKFSAPKRCSECRKKKKASRPSKENRK